MKEPNPYFVDKGPHLHGAYEKAAAEGKVMPNFPLTGGGNLYRDLVSQNTMNAYIHMDYHTELYPEAAEKYPGIGSEVRCNGMKLYFCIHHSTPVISGYNPDTQEVDLIFPRYEGKKWEARAGKSYLACRLPRATVKDMIECEMAFNDQHLKEFAQDGNLIRDGETCALAVAGRRALEQTRNVFEKVTGDTIKDPRRELENLAKQFATNDVAMNAIVSHDMLTDSSQIPFTLSQIEFMEAGDLVEKAKQIRRVVDQQTKMPIYDGGLAKRNLSN
jgi:hypothetical protein